MGIGIIIKDMQGNELAAVEELGQAWDYMKEHDLNQHAIFGRQQTCKLEYVPDSPAYDAWYKTWADSKVYPSFFDSEEERNRKWKEMYPYCDYNSETNIRTKLAQYRCKYVVLLKEGHIDEDDIDSWVTMYVAHNFDWISDFVCDFVMRCGGEVAIYKVTYEQDVIRLFKDKTYNKEAFKPFIENKYELFEEMWDVVGWHPVSVN